MPAGCPATSPSSRRRNKPPLEAVESSGKAGGGNPARPPAFAMANTDCFKNDSLEENRTDSGIDSGIDSYRSMLRSEEPREPSVDVGGPREKFSIVDERLDSAYDSSSISVESLTESRELSEQENLLTTITEDGDT